LYQGTQPRYERRRKCSISKSKSLCVAAEDGRHELDQVHPIVYGLPGHPGEPGQRVRQGSGGDRALGQTDVPLETRSEAMPVEVLAVT